VVPTSAGAVHCDGLDDEVLALREVGDTTVLEQRTLD